MNQPSFLVKWWLPVYTLVLRELVRFFRQRNRILGALGSPLVFWLLIGFGMQGVGESFKPTAAHAGMSAIEFLYPGTLVLILLFTAIFSTFSIIEDRQEGFLQAVLVAPVPRMSVVLGKILGGTILAVVQGLIFLVLAPTVHIWPQPLALLLVLVVMFLVSFGLTGLGFCFAWKMDSTQGFHAIMNLFLIPMWLLSGSLFPLTGAPAVLRWVMNLNPLTYGVVALRDALYLDRPRLADQMSFGMSLGVVVLFAVLMLGLATALARSRDRTGR